MRRLIYGTSARDDLGQILGYITREAQDRKVGATFVAKLRAQCEKISQFDGTLGTARPELRADIRSTQCQGYVIFFRYRADDVLEIFNILHASRDIESYSTGIDGLLPTSRAHGAQHAPTPAAQRQARLQMSHQRRVCGSNACDQCKPEKIHRFLPCLARKCAMVERPSADRLGGWAMAAFCAALRDQSAHAQHGRLSP